MTSSENPNLNSAVENDKVIKNLEDDCEMVIASSKTFLSNTQTQFLESARTNRLDVLSAIIKHSACDLNVKTNLDRTAMHMAASMGHIDAVKLLVEAEANIDFADKHGMTPLMWAAHNNHTEIVNFLIEKRASLTKTTKRGYTLLHIAAKTNALNVARLIYKWDRYFPAHYRDNNKMTAFLVAASNGSVDVAAFLSANKPISDQRDKTGKNGLHLAVIARSPGTVSMLCSHHEVKEMINALDDEFWSPLHYACHLNELESVYALLSNGAEPEINTKNATYPIIMAAHNGNYNVMELLLQCKVSLRKRNVNGNTPLHIAALANKVDAVRYLVSKGSNIEALNKRLQTPLMSAVEQGKAETAECLLLAGAKVDCRDKSNKSPIIMASNSGNSHIVDMIIKANILRRKFPEMAEKIRENYKRDPIYYERETTMSVSDGEESTFVGSPINVVTANKCIPDFADEFMESYFDSFQSRSSLPLPYRVKCQHLNRSKDFSRSWPHLCRLQSKPEEQNDDTKTENSPSQLECNSKRQIIMPKWCNNIGSKNLKSEHQHSSLGALNAKQHPMIISGKNVNSETPTMDPQTPTCSNDHKKENKFSLHNRQSSIAMSLRSYFSSNKFKRHSNKPNLQNETGNKTIFQSRSGYERCTTNICGTTRQTSSGELVFSISDHNEYDANDHEEGKYYKLLHHNRANADRLEECLFYLAKNMLRKKDWLKLAAFWNLTSDEINAIAFDATSHNSYQKHGYRVLCIWLHSLDAKDAPGPILAKSLQEIGRKDLARKIQKDAELLFLSTAKRGPKCSIS